MLQQSHNNYANLCLLTERLSLLYNILSRRLNITKFLTIYKDMLDFPCVIVHSGKIGPRTMRTKLNNNNTHNAEMHMKEKVEENYITLHL
jgi:hypothetical protein